MDAIQFGRVPVVAVLHGAVVGGGLELASSCHIRVAEESAYYGLPEGQRGIFVGGGGSARVPRLAGVQTMTDMMLTGRVLDAAEVSAAACRYACRLAPASPGAAMAARSLATRCRTSVMQALPHRRSVAADGCSSRR
jgi:enoyl-CoA hydratase/carnithine racemase